MLKYCIDMANMGWIDYRRYESGCLPHYSQFWKVPSV